MEIAERRAIASGLSLSEIRTGGGGPGAKVGGARGGKDDGFGGIGGTCDVGEGDVVGGTMGCVVPFVEGFWTGARWANTGVTGEYGGRGGVPGR